MVTAQPWRAGTWIAGFAPAWERFLRGVATLRVATPRKKRSQAGAKPAIQVPARQGWAVTIYIYNLSDGRQVQLSFANLDHLISAGIYDPKTKGTLDLVK